MKPNSPIVYNFGQLRHHNHSSGTRTIFLGTKERYNYILKNFENNSVKIFTSYRSKFGNATALKSAQVFSLSISCFVSENKEIKYNDSNPLKLFELVDTSNLQISKEFNMKLLITLKHTSL